MHADDHNPKVVELPDETATLALGASLAGCAAAGLRIYLEGDLGTGKTTLVRGMLQSLGYAGRVKSPTYTLVEVHVVSGLHFYHFDFYRLDRAEEFLDAGLDEYFSGSGVCVVEWPDKAAPYLPDADMRIGLAHSGPGRSATVAACSLRGVQCLTKISGAAA